MSLLPSYSQNDPLQQSHTSDISPNLSCYPVTPPQPVLTIPPPIDPPAYSPPDVIVNITQNQNREEESSKNIVQGENIKLRSYKAFYYLMACVYGFTLVISCVIINNFLKLVSICTQILIMESNKVKLT